MARDDHDRTIRALYEKVGDIGELPAMAGLVARQLGVNAARIGLPPDLAEPRNPFLDFNLDSAVTRDYLSHWASLDLWYAGHQRRRAQVKGPIVVTHREMVSIDVLHRSPFYNDFLAPQGLASCTVVDLDAVSAGDAVDSSVAFLSEIGEKEVQADDLRSARPLLQHLGQAFRLTFEMERARGRHAALIDGLEAIGQRIALLSATGKLLYASPGFLAALDGVLVIRNDRLQATHAGADGALEAAIRTAARPGGTGDVVIVPKRGFRLHCLLKIYPLPERAQALSSETWARVLIQLHDPAQRRAPAWSAVTRLFDLTPAELRLCEALHAGLALSEYCARQHISQATARTQLHSVFRKTGTNRQSELMALLADLTIA